MIWRQTSRGLPLHRDKPGGLRNSFARMGCLAWHLRTELDVGIDSEQEYVQEREERPRDRAPDAGHCQRGWPFYTRRT